MPFAFHISLFAVDLFSVSLQNPVNTFAWLIANFELLGPVISLGVDTRLFVKPIYKTGFYIPVALAYLILSVLSIMAGPVHRANIFHLVCLLCCAVLCIMPTFSPGVA